MGKPKRVIFYSWQSDSPGSTNRYFIEDALKKAVGAIMADDSVEVEPVIDRDTQGTPGAVDISKTIFEKIGRSAVFVADVSIINRGKRPTPAASPARPPASGISFLRCGYRDAAGNLTRDGSTFAPRTQQDQSGFFSSQ
jgi:hypothetical protein